MWKCRVYMCMSVCVCTVELVCANDTHKIVGHMFSSWLPVDWLTCQSLQQQRVFNRFTVWRPSQTRKQTDPKPAAAGLHCFFPLYNYNNNKKIRFFFLHCIAGLQCVKCLYRRKHLRTKEKCHREKVGRVTWLTWSKLEVMFIERENYTLRPCRMIGLP